MTYQTVRSERILLDQARLTDRADVLTSAAWVRAITACGSLLIAACGAEPAASESPARSASVGRKV